MTKSWRTKRARELLTVFASIRSEKVAGLFLRDLCTLDEIEKMAERWEVARLLHQGLSYRVVSKKTGASTTTVTRVAHWLKSGEGGYQAMLRK